MSNEQLLAQLRHSLDGIILWGKSLAGHLERVKTTLHLQEFPAQQDFERAASSEALPDCDVENDWAALLWPIYSDLRAWWEAWYTAQDTLDELATTGLVNDKAKPLAERWTTKLRRTLNDVAAWLSYTGPRQAAAKTTDVAVQLLIRNLASGQVPTNWGERLHQLRQYDAELLSFQNELGVRETASPDQRLPIARAVAKSERVWLFGPDKEPWIDGKPKKMLTDSQYDCVQTLIEAGGAGLTDDELVTKSGHGGARETLKTLSERNVEWGSVIRFPGVTGGVYRIE